MEEDVRDWIRKKMQKLNEGESVLVPAEQPTQIEQPEKPEQSKTEPEQPETERTETKKTETEQPITKMKPKLTLGSVDVDKKIQESIRTAEHRTVENKADVEELAEEKHEEYETEHLGQIEQIDVSRTPPGKPRLSSMPIAEPIAKPSLPRPSLPKPSFSRPSFPRPSFPKPSLPKPSLPEFKKPGILNRKRMLIIIFCSLAGSIAGYLIFLFIIK